jgi:hypothetical protein
MIIWTTFLLVVPWLIVSAACAWANATESGGRAPFRAAFLFTSPADLGIVLAVLIALSLAPRLLRQPRATIVAVVLAAGGLVALGHTAEPLIRAERMRMHALALRAAAVNEQVASGRRDIEMLPAPLLTADTQALDLSFEPLNAQRPWVVALLRSFYRIPATERVAILTRQPADYCLESISASWVGVRSCQQLAADG